MPPDPMCFDGLAQVVPLLERAFGPERDRRATGGWCRRAPTACRGRELPLRGRATRVFRPFKLDVLRIEAGAVAEITTFGPSRFPAFGLPETLG